MTLSNYLEVSFYLCIEKRRPLLYEVSPFGVPFLVPLTLGLTRLFEEKGGIVEAAAKVLNCQDKELEKNITLLYNKIGKLY